MSSFFDAIKNKVNILTIIQRKIALKKHGKDYIGLCPFHHEKTPSFRVNSIKNFFYCFGCSSGGDVITFIAKTQNMQYKAAALSLAKEFNIDLPRLNYNELLENKNKKSTSIFLEQVNEHFMSNLFAKKIDSNNALQYLLNRNINLKEIHNYQLGFANSNLINLFFNDLQKLSQSGLIAKSESNEMYEVFRNRLIIPIRNQYNNLIAFGARSLIGKMPKYLNSPETLIFKKSSALYGENIAFNHGYKDSSILLVEGYFDCIMLQISGFLNTVASLGTSVTTEHLTKIWTRFEEIIICMDSDKAGKIATKKIINIAIQKINCTNKISFIYLPDGYDPDLFIREKGVDQFKELLNKREAMSEVIWKLELENQTINSAEDLAMFESNIKTICNKIQDPILKSTFLSVFKTKSWSLHKKTFFTKNINKTSQNNEINYTKIIKNTINATNISSKLDTTISNSKIFNNINIDQQINNFNKNKILQYENSNNSNNYRQKDSFKYKNLNYYHNNAQKAEVINNHILLKFILKEIDIIEITIIAQLIIIFEVNLTLFKINNLIISNQKDQNIINIEEEKNCIINCYQDYFLNFDFTNEKIQAIKHNISNNQFPSNNVFEYNQISTIMAFKNNILTALLDDMKNIIFNILKMHTSYNSFVKMLNFSFKSQLTLINYHINNIDPQKQIDNQQTQEDYEQIKDEINNFNKNILQDLDLTRLKHELAKLQAKYDNLMIEKIQDIELIQLYINNIKRKQLEIKEKQTKI